jgi:hypothetical protein
VSQNQNKPTFNKEEIFNLSQIALRVLDFELGVLSDPFDQAFLLQLVGPQHELHIVTRILASVEPDLRDIDWVLHVIDLTMVKLGTSF